MAAALASVKQNEKGTPNISSLNKIIGTGGKLSQDME